MQNGMRMYLCPVSVLFRAYSMSKIAVRPRGRPCPWPRQPIHFAAFEVKALKAGTFPLPWPYKLAQNPLTIGMKLAIRLSLLNISSDPLLTACMPS